MPNKVATIRANVLETEDWIKRLPGHQNEVALHDKLAAKYQAEGKKGGPESGHHGHQGRPGHVGGSVPSGRQPELVTIQETPQPEPKAGKLSGTQEEIWTRSLSKGGVNDDDSTRKLLSIFKEKCLEYAFASGNIDEISDDCWRVVGSETRSSLKDQLCRDLAARSGLPYDKVNEMVHQWARTSNKYPLALLMQTAMADELGVPLSDWQQEVVEERGGLAEIINQSYDDDDIDADDARRFAKAVYENTQQHLSSLGLKPNDRVYLWRGVHMKAGGLQEVTSIPYGGNVMESWSIAKAVGDEFGWSGSHHPGYHKALISAWVPVRNIVATPFTGPGCLAEGEIVVAGSQPGNTVWVDEDYERGITDPERKQHPAPGVADQAILTIDFYESDDWIKQVPGYESDAEDEKGGPKSGHHGHRGRPGQVGGSVPSGRQPEKEGEPGTGGAPEPWPEHFASVAELEAYAEKRYPWMKFGLSGMDQQTAEEAVNQWRLLEEQYPNTARTVSYLGLYRDADSNSTDGAAYLPGHAWACVRKSTVSGDLGLQRGIYLNESSWTNRSKFMGELEGCQTPEGIGLVSFHPLDCDTPASVITHEFGHLFRERAMDQSRNGIRLAEYVTPEGLGDPDRALEGWINGVVDRGYEVSGYAKSSAGEFLAESITMLWHSPKSSQPTFVQHVGPLLSWLDSAKGYVYAWSSLTGKYPTAVAIMNLPTEAERQMGWAAAKPLYRFLRRLGTAERESILE